MPVTLKKRKGMAMHRMGKRRVAFRFYVLLFVATAILAYGLFYAYNRLVQRTAVIEKGDMSNEYTAQAVIARIEKVTDTESFSSVQYYADEGANVYQGNRIADVYSVGFSRTDENKLLNVRSEIKAQQKLMPVYQDQQLDRMNQQIREIAHELEMLVHGKQAGNLLNLERQLQTALSRRQDHLKQKYATDQNLRALYENEATLVKKIETWTYNYLATTDCIVSFYTDGYESMLDSDSLDTVTVSQIRSILNGEAPIQSTAQRGRIAVYREVVPRGFYLMLISYDNKWAPQDGVSYKVQLEGYEDALFDAVVLSHSKSGNETFVRTFVDSDVKPVLNTRTARATIGELYVSGLKVPFRALLIQDNQVGVVVSNDGGRFVPVKIMEQTSDYAIVQSISPGLLSEGQKVMIF